MKFIYFSIEFKHSEDKTHTLVSDTSTIERHVRPQMVPPDHNLFPTSKEHKDHIEEEGSSINSLSDDEDYNFMGSGSGDGAWKEDRVNDQETERSNAERLLVKPG